MLTSGTDLLCKQIKLHLPWATFQFGSSSTSVRVIVPSLCKVHEAKLVECGLTLCLGEGFIPRGLIVQVFHHFLALYPKLPKPFFSLFYPQLCNTWRLFTGHPQDYF